jgi:4'-phosphopantetheinyl transferase
MTWRWLALGASSLPIGDEWLGPRERNVVAQLSVPKRRLEWRLGRFAAKQALASSLGIDRLDRIELIPASDGAPEAFVDGEATQLFVSISHRERVAACVWSRDFPVGCDLEVVEARTSRFVDDFFTEAERERISAMTGKERNRHVALTWSAKESALKVLRVGLRRDTRGVEVQIEDSEPDEAGWRGISATIVSEALRLRGWWRQDDDVVLTVLSAGVGLPNDPKPE